MIVYESVFVLLLGKNKKAAIYSCVEEKDSFTVELLKMARQHILGGGAYVVRQM